VLALVVPRWVEHHTVSVVEDEYELDQKIQMTISSGVSDFRREEPIGTPRAAT
jgi:hypothetical protein